jgi:glycosyltransferase involved in cell wall biosynthesis
VPDSPEIAVVVPSHRAESTLDACLSGLLGQTLSPEQFEIHVVDTGEDGARSLVSERANAWNGRLVYHEAQERGPGRQRNFGAQQTKAPYVAFTDADCVPEPQWLEAGLPRLRAGASIVHGPTLTPNGTPPPPFSHAIFVTGPSVLYESCNLMFQADAMRRAGGFPSDLFDETGAVMSEDTELAWAVRRAQGRAVFEPRAIVRHVVHPPDFRRHLRYAWQARFFPRLVRRVPELRTEALTARVFLGRRSLRSCAALAGLALGRHTRWAYLLATPYLLDLTRAARATRDPSSAAIVATGQMMADATREAALVYGSVRYRSLVL